MSHENSLKLRPIRVAELCLRSAYLHKGNALAALGREDEARETYLKVMPMLEPEPRCGRLDWERVSILVNIGNTYSRQGNYDKSNEQYTVAEALGREHISAHEGNQIDGMGIVVVSMRARAFALKKMEEKMKENRYSRRLLKRRFSSTLKTRRKRRNKKRPHRKLPQPNSPYKAQLP